MTTEVGSASEVKKESDQLGADATKEKPKEVAENQQNQTSDPEEEKGSQSSPPTESQSSPRRQKKEKDPSESRGISRFIPPWLKKQKSYNLVVAKDGGDKKEPTEPVVEEQVLDKEESLPEEERQAKGDAEETAQRKQQEIKLDVKEEKPLVSSQETQVFWEVIGSEGFDGITRLTERICFEPFPDFLYSDTALAYCIWNMDLGGSTTTFSCYSF